MRVGVIGIGKMGMLHAGIMNALEDVELCAASDNSKFLLGAAKGLKETLGVYDDYVDLLDNEKPDVAIIATPVFLHVPMAVACVDRNIPFFVEKPLCPKSHDAEHLIEEIERRNLKTMVGYMMRYVETFMKTKELLDSGVLGRFITFNASIYVSQLFTTGKGWRYNKEESGGGVVASQATHLVDLLRWYFGPVERVSGHTINWYSEEVEDFAHVHLEFKSGLTGWFDSSWSMRHHRLLQINIQCHAENGTLFVSDDFVKLYLDEGTNGFASGWTHFNKPDLFEGVVIDVGGPQYTRQDIHFIDSLKQNKKVESDARNGYEVQKIVDKIYESAMKLGEPVTVT